MRGLLEGDQELCEKGKEVTYDPLATIAPKKDESRSSLDLLSRDHKREEELQTHLRALLEREEGRRGGHREWRRKVQ